MGALLITDPYEVINILGELFSGEYFSDNEYCRQITGCIICEFAYWEAWEIIREATL